MTSNPCFVYQPPVAFRGSRNYVHSTDLYEDVSAGARKSGLGFDGPLELRIGQRITCVPRYEFSPGRLESSDEAASCTFVSEGAAWHCLIRPGDQPVEASKPYDVTPARDLAHVSDRRIELQGESGMRPIEVVTALAVVIHNRTLPPDESERWMLARLTLDRPLPDDCARWTAIQIDRVIGNRMTLSKVFDRNGELGSVTFLLAELHMQDN